MGAGSKSDGFRKRMKPVRAVYNAGWGGGWALQKTIGEATTPATPALNLRASKQEGGGEHAVVAETLKG